MEVADIRRGAGGSGDGGLLEKIVGSGRASEDLYIRYTKTEFADAMRGVGGTEDLGAHLLEGLDSYLEDIDERLTISRMVSDSVIKGMVEAVEKMAEEKIAVKDLEIARMKTNLAFLESGDEESEDITEVSSDRNELGTVLMASLEETGHYQQLGVQICERINEVSNVKKELDSLLKSLPGSESGLISHGSGDMDHLNSKLFSSHVSTSSSFWVENGHSEGSKNGMPETWDVAQLGHLNTEELVKHFNSIITKMKRDHESQVQQMTEDYFSLKREYFKEKGYSLPNRKEKDLDTVRKRFSEVIVKLEDILAENEKHSIFSKNAMTLTTLKDTVDNLLSENLKLRKSLAKKTKEIKNLTLQVSSVEGNLKKLMGDLESAAEDVEIEKFLIGEVYGCVFRESTLYNSGNIEELAMLYAGTGDAKATRESGIEDSETELLISQGLAGVIFSESVMEANLIIDDMTKKYLHECNIRTSLQSKSLEMEEELKLLKEDKSNLKQKVDLVEAMLKEKEKLVGELSIELSEERDQHELTSCQISKLESRIVWLQSSLDKRDEEVDLFKRQLVEALDQVELCKLERNKVKEENELMSEKLSVAIEEGQRFHAIAEKKQMDMALLESAKNEQSRLMQSIIGPILGLSREFSELESRVAEDIKMKSLRLEKNSSLLQCLLKKSNILRRTVTVSKQKLEKKSADLQKAETEVDLLGDQVDTLFNLLEKIYIALDHYSPILQHYPGIMEILKLIRRELSGESLKFK